MKMYRHPYPTRDSKRSVIREILAVPNLSAVVRQAAVDWVQECRHWLPISRETFAHFSQEADIYDDGTYAIQRPAAIHDRCRIAVIDRGDEDGCWLVLFDLDNTDEQTFPFDTETLTFPNDHDELPSCFPYHDFGQYRQRRPY